MTSDNARLNIEHFEQPGELTYEFAAHLAANRIAQGVTIGFYRREDLEQAVEEFLSQRPSDAEEAERVKLWIESLPWNEGRRMAFSFIW